MKGLWKLGLLISLAGAIYLSVRGSLTNGWYSCTSLTRTYSCNLIEWSSQIVIIALIIFIALTVIIFGFKFLFKAKKGDRKIFQKLAIKKANNQAKEKSDIPQEEVEKVMKKIKI